MATSRKTPERSAQRWPFVLAAILLCVSEPLLPAAAAQVQVPQNDGLVTDLGDFLSSGEEAQLEALMQSYMSGSGHEIALLTLQDLGGRSIEEVGVAVARDWGLGKADAGEAALLIVSRAERKTRIEVGRYLEGKLTDAVSRRILDDVLSPHFKAGRFAEGLTASIVAINAAAGGDYSAIDQGARSAKRRGGRSILSSLLTLAFFMFIMFSSRNSRRGGMGGMWPLLFLMGGNNRHHHGGGFGGGSGGGFGGGGGGFGGFGGGGSFGGGGASGGW
ncbi:MAG: hypothetical protein DHS20C15_27980 [Planctomycetota bacterium]|nr:MAG: hypothetical protein DHS20C15_27980 [Planctomycetota bacterium]